MTNPEGCEYGHLLRQSFEAFCTRLDSKLEGIETLLRVWRDIKFVRIEAQIVEVNKMLIDVIQQNGKSLATAERAEVCANKSNEKVDSLWWKIFLSIVGSTILSNAILFAAYKFLGGM